MTGPADADRNGSSLPRSLRPRSRHDEINEELRFHLDATVEDLMENGLDRAAAERVARRRFGDLDATTRGLDAIRHRATVRRRRATRMQTLFDILQSAARSARRHPALSAAVVALLGLGLGATAVTGGLVDQLLLRPPVGVDDADELRSVLVERDFLGSRITNTSHSWFDVTDLEEADSFEGVTAFSSTRVTLGRGPEAERVRGMVVSGTFFELLGTEPLMGRLLTPADDRPEGTPAVVLGYGLWRERFAADPDVLDTTVELRNGHYSVVGIAPRGFSGTGIDRVDLWLPLHHAADMMVSDNWNDSRDVSWLEAVVRLADGVAPEAGAAEATTLHRLGRSDNPRYDPHADVVLSAIRGGDGDGEITVAALLAGFSLLLLVLVCTNVANLLLAHAIHGRADHGVRLALGMSRRRLLMEQLTLGVLLALAGGLLALVVAQWGGTAVRALLLPDLAAADALTARTLLFLLAATVASGFAAALMPALEARRSSESTGRGGSRVTDRGTARRTLLTVQVALSVLMLVGAGLFLHSFERAAGVDLGFDDRGLVVVSLEHDRGVAGEDALRDLERVDDLLSRRPDLEGVTSARVAPFLGSWAIGLRVPGREEVPRSEEGGPYIYPVGPDFFSTLGLELLQGRSFTDADRGGAPLVTVVNQNMAEAFWPGESALGQCLVINPQGDESTCTEVVGIVENAHRQSIEEAEQFLYYVPLAQEVLPPGSRTFYVRSGRDPDELATELATVLAPELATVRSVRARPFVDLVAPQLETWRLGATLFGVFAVLALAVAAAGLFSSLSFEVARRRREIGVRSALGATAAALARFLLVQALLPVLAGLVAGVVLARAAAPLVRDHLFGIGAADPAAFVAALGAMVLASLLAAAGPIVRATRIDAATQLREE